MGIVNSYSFEETSRMKANPGVIVLTDQAANHDRLRSVLDDWGYSEKEVQQFLSEMSTSIGFAQKSKSIDVFSLR